MTTPLPPQLQYKKLSRPWALWVDSTALGSASATWVKVKGKRSLTLGISKSAADTSDSESDGWNSELITARAWEVVFEGQETGTIASDVRTPDPGQQILIAKGLATGEDAQVRMKIQYGEDGPGYTAYANVDWGGTGGSQSDGVDPANFTLTSAGALLPFVAPA